MAPHNDTVCRRNINKGVHLEELEVSGTIILKRVTKFEREEFKWIVVAQYCENWITFCEPSNKYFCSTKWGKGWTF
jgi:hypothetical protein